MNKELNLAPLQELLTTGIDARQLAEELDELLFDYTQCILRLHLHRQENEDFIHEKAPDFIFYPSVRRSLRLRRVKRKSLTFIFRPNATGTTSI